MHTEPIESMKPQHANNASNNVNANAKLPNAASVTGSGAGGQQQNNNNNVQNEKYGVDPLDPRLRQAFKDALIASQEGTKVKVSQSKLEMGKTFLFTERLLVIQFTEMN